MVQQLDMGFTVTQKVREAAKCAGITVDFDHYEQHLYICDMVMVHLDEVYRKHFQGKGALCLLDCFNINENEEHRKAFTTYMNVVLAVFTDLTKGKDFQQTLKKGFNTAHGAWGALARFKEMFYPFDGQVCLPLATVSILGDLQESILTGKQVITKVSHWFNGLASHMLWMRGCELSAQVPSDVIVVKLGQMCPPDTGNALQDGLALSVGSLELHPVTRF